MYLGLWMFRNKRFYPVTFAVCTFLLAACSSDSENDFLPVTVPLGANEAVFFQNNATCFDGQGNLTATAYIFDDPDQGTDDIDGTAPDPVQTVDIVDYDGGLYVYDIVFDNNGTYRAAITCEADLDNTGTDDNIRFLLRGTFVRIDRIRENFINGPLPVGHIETTMDCFGCHTVSDVYDIAVVDHDYVLGTCLDCHTPNP